MARLLKKTKKKTEGVTFAHMYLILLKGNRPLRTGKLQVKHTLYLAT